MLTVCESGGGSRDSQDRDPGKHILAQIRRDSLEAAQATRWGSDAEQVWWASRNRVQEGGQHECVDIAV